MSVLTVLGVLAILGVIIVVVLLSLGIIKISSSRKKGNSNSGLPKGKKAPKPSCGPDGNNFIKPTPFKTGFFDNARHVSANLCMDKPVRYPINLPYVNYGLPKISDDCLCTEFIQAP